MRKIVGGTGAALAVKLVTGFAIAALAAAGATEAAITGSVNPNDWGRQVVQQVSNCKAALQPGQHGIGQCVSAFARQHGSAVSDDHRASGARTNHNGKDKSKDKSGKGDNGKGNNGKSENGKGDNGHGKPSPEAGS